MNSRIKADIVLSHFDTVNASKLIYSIEDKYYYMIINYQFCIKEYYIVTDDSEYKIYPIRKTKNKKQKQKELQMFLETNPFDLSKYHTDYITNILDAECCTFGRRTYFVIKDSDGKRYGEFHLFMPIIPSPIDLNLWVYLVRRLAEQIK